MTVDEPNTTPEMPEPDAVPAEEEGERYDGGEIPTGEPSEDLDED